MLAMASPWQLLCLTSRPALSTALLVGAVPEVTHAMSPYKQTLPTRWNAAMSVYRAAQSVLASPFLPQCACLPHLHIPQSCVKVTGSLEAQYRLLHAPIWREGRLDV